MGLINQKIEVVLSGKNIPYYENLGYEIPRVYRKYGLSTPQRTKIIVDVLDLSKGSDVKVDVQCDCCGEIHKVSYYNYNKYRNEDKYYCRKCNKLSDRNPNWNYNKTNTERILQRNYVDYDIFIHKVLARDNYTCVITGKTNKEAKLVVHHLNSYDWDFDGRIDVCNGITITEELHKAFHSQYGYGQNTRQQFVEFTGKVDLILKNYNGEVPTARWAYCITDNEIIQNVKRYAEKNHIADTGIYNCCNGKLYTYYNKIYIWYDKYLCMSKNDLNIYVDICKNSRSKKVICTTTNKVFNSVIEAAAFYNIRESGISACCRGEYKHSGNLSDDTPLCWMYLSDYVKIPEKGINLQTQETSKFCGKRQVMCITTGKLFKSITEATNYYKIPVTGVSCCCRGIQKTAGKLPNGKPLKWIYYNEFLKLSKEEQNKLLANIL